MKNDYSLFDALRASLRRFVPKKEMEFLIFSYRLPMFLAFDCNHLIYIQYPWVSLQVTWMLSKKKKRVPPSSLYTSGCIRNVCWREKRRWLMMEENPPFFWGGVSPSSAFGWVGDIGWHGEIATDPSVSSISAWNQSRLKELLSFHIIGYSCVCFLYNESVCHSSGKIFISSMDPLDNVDSSSDAIQIQYVTRE